MIERIPVQAQHVAGKEKRALNKKLFQQLENAGLPNPDQIAETLSEIGVTTDLESFYPLFKEKEQELILDTLYHSSQVQINSQNIKIATDRAGKIVYALRSYSHNYASDTRLSISVAETIDNVLILFNNIIKQGIEINKHYDDVPPVSANPDELQQVWTNIIQNAFQAMKFQGHLDINIDHQTTQEIGRSKFDKLQEFVVISITDDGPGIPESIQPNLFEAFVTTKASGVGSGLGLHISQKIVRDHGGEITFESEPGKTTFMVWLPVKV
jgi:signal transduction histidine kinase